MAAFETAVMDETDLEKRTERSVTVLRLPSAPTGAEAEAFLSRLRQTAANGRPLLVLDGSAIQRLDPRMALLLLECLEAALMRSGDVKLAAIPLDEQPVLGAQGSARLFAVFDTVDEAVNSYYALPSSMAAESAA